MTQRLYYDDTYLAEFEATVLECRETEGKFLIRLDRSAFYPTSGGQPYDTGMLGSARVTDVFSDKEGEVWHAVDSPIAEDTAVVGKIDWERRFDHMQQHAGEHLLANAAYRMLGGHTIGLHLGSENASIDMDLPDGSTHITDAQLRALEDDVNGWIQRDVPIRQWFPAADELSELPLRKKPTVSEHVRVVQIGELEFCACGGTHPSSAGQIGLVKIIDARPSRGKLRLTFVCGKRAYELLRDYYNIAKNTAEELSTSVYNVPTLVGSMAEQLKEAERKLAEVSKQALMAGLGDLLKEAKISMSGVRVISTFAEADVASARNLASALANEGNLAAFIGVRTSGSCAYIACRSEDIDMNMGAILSEAAKKSGGKGGGRPDFAQGGGPEEMLEMMTALALVK